ncbi:hypothetical protein XENOCAPTIV_013202 [Xenoophorus captivus]|uniref:DNA polymerase alpha subunit B N-terminal domain-containing protein n=1 Tax=Xenoophorus captivus TaxID=1517983 RepID=A0ABV0QI16_9TELE
MALVTTESLKADLETFEITCEDESVLDKMVELCICSRTQAEQMLNEWVAYSTTKGGLELTLENLEHFDHEFLNKRDKSRSSSRKDDSYNQTRDVHLLDLIKAKEEVENLLDSYSTPGKPSQKRALSTPEHPQSKRTTALLTSPGLLLSPANFSPRYYSATHT